MDCYYRPHQRTFSAVPHIPTIPLVDKSVGFPLSMEAEDRSCAYEHLQYLQSHFPFSRCLSYFPVFVVFLTICKANSIMFRALIFPLLTSIIPIVSAECYFPNGTSTASLGTDNVPCNESPGVQSMCCRLDNSSTADTCTSYGLCIPVDKSHPWRGTCTDKTWKDPACLNICTQGEGESKKIGSMIFFFDTCGLSCLEPDSRGYKYTDNYSPLTFCADGSLCCGDGKDTEACCAGNHGYVLENGRIITSSQTSPFPTASISTAISAQSSTSAARATPTPSNSPSSGTDTGAIVGGVVGGVAGVAALSLAFWYFMIRRNVKGRDLPIGYESYATGKQQHWQEPEELSAEGIRGELDSSPETRQEMGVGRGRYS